MTVTASCAGFRDLPADETETHTIKHFDLDELIPDDDDTYHPGAGED